MNKDSRDMFDIISPTAIRTAANNDRYSRLEQRTVKQFVQALGGKYSIKNYTCDWFNTYVDSWFSLGVAKFPRSTTFSKDISCLMRGTIDRAAIYQTYLDTKESFSPDSKIVCVTKYADSANDYVIYNWGPPLSGNQAVTTITVRIFKEDSYNVVSIMELKAFIAAFVKG